MTPLESRKYLLMAESELNRAQMIEEWQMMSDEVHALTNRAQSLCTLGSAAATLVSGLGFCRGKPREVEAKKPSWLQSILKGVDLLAAVWPACRPPGRER